ncbi:pyruvate dehydrogenase (acetyl-transferring), homodimeric type [Candidatus Berkiella cookevillensis]|uniref:Pyruvate dehydrogenase E1 component n=1 Tax=Candidatus Berkiella cookevillensis TaxID=437022 RepID=A0A0Q9YR08_9GAMM|nr:pyruvate dehydrogenase (acetyl-transferring), homodimeric type [Candidatus Berkiella cookevillensis]MCS5708185.1 pyruvate dehydrogenase (acetyl-transferring), homodimeric type [Candidatus Berkiella cookevillensis]
MQRPDDLDPTETQEWLDALDSVVKNSGATRAQYLLDKLSYYASLKGCRSEQHKNTPYCNTISVQEQPSVEGDPEAEERGRALIRWNAMAMVVRAQKVDGSLGGHIGTFASSATLYDVGFNHFWRGPNHPTGGDLLYIQGHASPGIYARSYLEGEITEEQLVNFRREVDGKGLSSYPHPWLMPHYWQFPTVSMGLGALQAIYQARFMKYMENRGFVEKSDRKVWCFCGDGEMDEPESLGGLSLAGRERLDNLVIVINCNLQRLDGPVRGNSRIIQELETVFRGANWNVIKVIWGDSWDPLFAADRDGLLLKRMEEAVDGDYQNYKAKGGAYTREHFFGKYPELKKLVEHLSDDDIWRLSRGGHDPQKIFAAYRSASLHKGQPTVILAKTVKGYGLGAAGEAQNIAHNVKKVSTEDLKIFRDRFHLPISDEEIETVPFYNPGENNPAIKYMKERRKQLGGSLPYRHASVDEKFEIPNLESFAAQLQGTKDREISTTMAFVRILSQLVKDKSIGKRIVPIVPDEARTFGMEGLFRQIGIYSSVGQMYQPVDADQVMYYKEATDGQILEEGINEPGAFCSWIAAATAYSTYQKTMIPFYIYYSMFGFQRIGDLAWAAGDSRAKGFLLGGTSGRTTLNGEGLQHQDGHSHILAGTIPNCVTYDPTYSYELAVIIQHGLKRMYEDNENLYFYITLMNENYVHPDMPQGVEEGIIKGMYLLQKAKKIQKCHVQLMGSGTILLEVLKAVELLEKYQVSADVWSVTSINELRKDALTVARENLLNPEKTKKLSYVETLLKDVQGPVIAATDYMKSYVDGIHPFIKQRFYALGTDGFGRSDTRSRLRKHFEVDSHMIAYTALVGLFEEGKIDQKILLKAREALEIAPDKLDPRFL